MWSESPWYNYRYCMEAGSNTHMYPWQASTDANDTIICTTITSWINKNKKPNYTLKGSDFQHSWILGIVTISVPFFLMVINKNSHILWCAYMYVCMWEGEVCVYVCGRGRCVYVYVGRGVGVWVCVWARAGMYRIIASSNMSLFPGQPPMLLMITSPCPFL